MDQVPVIKAFSDSVIKWLAEYSTEENSVIQRYDVSFQKIQRFAADLGHVCDVAMEHGYIYLPGRPVPLDGGPCADL